MKKEILVEIIERSIGRVGSDDKLRQIEKKICSGEVDAFPSKIELLKEYRRLLEESKISRDKKLEAVLVKKRVRTISGVAPVAIFTKPNQCPGNCHFCPTQEDIPKSYLDNEPAVMRAERNNYRPIEQVWDRMEALSMEGHPIDKLELIIMGGSFSNYQTSYKKEFVKKVFWAANNFTPGINKQEAKNYPSDSSLIDLQKDNEQTNYRIIGMSVETRPDLIDSREIKLWRELGITRVEIGVQIVNDQVLRKNNRGHTTTEIIKSTKLLKDNGFKLIYHLMPGLPGSDKEKDLMSFKKVFTEQKYKPDQIKIYPCVVVKGSKIYDWYLEGKFKPYQSVQLITLLSQVKSLVPYWIRVIRVIRDIPSQSIIAGNKVNNLRQVVLRRMNEQENSCDCIRCREVKDNNKEEEVKLFVEKYQSSQGEEIFFSYENLERTRLYGILRLRIPNNKNNQSKFEVLKDAALIRELHVYGPAVKINRKDKIKSQHKGIGGRLMNRAENYVKNRTELNKLAVISGVGVRQYYRNIGYYLQDSYMVKIIDN